MKSLNSFIPDNDMFSPEIMVWIKKEGFISHSNDSYCFKNTGLEWESECFWKSVDDSSFSISVYIFKSGIGVDVDYDCGGNSSNIFWKFDFYKQFEEIYDLMVEYVNGFR